MADLGWICSECVRLIDAHARDGKKPTVPQVLPVVKEYYMAHASGGSLHIVLDDGNVDDDDVEFCVDWADRESDHPGVLLANVLLLMSKTQRRKLHKADHV